MSNPSYESIGALAPEAERAAFQQAGWDGLAGSPPALRPEATEQQAATFTRWNVRANRQIAAIEGTAEPAAGYGRDANEPLPAATPISSFIRGARKEDGR